VVWCGVQVSKVCKHASTDPPQSAFLSVADTSSVAGVQPSDLAKSWNVGKRSLSTTMGSATQIPDKIF
jgi:hypothetical protein